MSELVGLKITFAIVSALVCLAGGLIPQKLADSANAISLANCLSGGVLLGAALMHLLAEASEEWTVHMGSKAYPWHFFMAGFGTIICATVSQGLNAHHSHSHSHSHGGHSTPHDTHDAEENQSLLNNNSTNGNGGAKTGPAHRQLNVGIPYVLALTMAFECFFTGIALGVETTTVSCVAVFIAIVSHVWAEAFALVVTAMRAEFDNWQQKKLLAIFCLASPLGVLVGLTIDEAGANSTVTGVLLRGFCAGLFLYVALIELIPGEFADTSAATPSKLFLLSSGFALMAVVAAIA